MPSIKNELEKPRPDVSVLVDLLSREKKYACFDEQVHLLGTSGRSFSYSEFANALIRRAKQASSDTALQEVDEYLNSETLALEYSLLLPGIHLEQDFTFSNGIKLLAVENISDSAVKDLLEKQRRETWVGASRVNTALVASYQVAKDHYPNTEAGEALSQPPRPPYQTLEDTRLILSLVRSEHHGVSALAGIIIVPKNLSFLESSIGWNSFSEPQEHMGPNILEIQTQKADCLLQKFEDLDEETKDRLRISLKRLNSAKINAGPNWVNSCIDMRICLENLFLNPATKNTINKTLKERMPKHTKYTKKQVEKMYKFLSTVVHTGRIPGNENNLFDYLKVIQDALTKFINEGGYPIWPEMKKKGKIERLIICIKEVFS